MKGRKRHLLVDTEGLLLTVVVHAADVQDRDGGRFVLSTISARFPRLCHLWVDAGYRGRFVGWVGTTLSWSVEVVQHWWTGVRGVWVPESGEASEIPTGFQVLPRRWTPRVPRRTDLRLAGQVSPFEQRLRGAAGDE